MVTTPVPIFVSSDSERITVSTAAVGFTAAKVTTRTHSAFCRVETAAIRINTKNTPTAGGTEGSPLMNDGDVFTVLGRTDLLAFRAIRQGGTDAVLHVIYQGFEA